MKTTHMRKFNHNPDQNASAIIDEVEENESPIIGSTSRKFNTLEPVLSVS